MENNPVKYAAIDCEVDRCIHIAPVVDGEPNLGELIADAWASDHAKLIVDALNRETSLVKQLVEALRERTGYYYQRDVPHQSQHPHCQCRECTDRRCDHALAKALEAGYE